MAVKKSELYSSLWSSCDELRGGMDASQYKDYVLALLFIKYVSDRFAGRPFAQIAVPTGASFADMVALKGKPDIGDQINKKIVGPLWQANHLSDPPDFNDPAKLGSGKEMVERLTNLIAVFDNPDLDFSKNRAEGDDLLGETYEYLMRHFAMESGKGGDGFYIPANVCHLITEIIGISKARNGDPVSVYDPACGTGSLLIAAARTSGLKAWIYGEEPNSRSATLARMRLMTYGVVDADILVGDALSHPRFRSGEGLQTFDFVISCPPFRLRRWDRLNPANEDPFRRFKFGNPPKSSADLAFAQHMIASLASKGKMAIVVPHGVLFRRGPEAVIRKAIIEADLIEAVIGLPSSLLSYTNIPICILICNKSKAAAQSEKILFINADRCFETSKRSNLLPSEEISRIVAAFDAYSDSDQFSRVVHLAEIRANEFNLNVSRYVDTSELSRYLKQYCDSLEKFQLSDLAVEMNSAAPTKPFQDKANAVYVPKSMGRLEASVSFQDAYDRTDRYHQVVLKDNALAPYVAQFLNSTIGRLSLSALANGSVLNRISLDDLKECVVALPELDVQRASIESYQKLVVLRKSIEKIAQDISLNPRESIEFHTQLDGMLEAANKLSDSDHIRSLIRQGESKTVEFKETYSLCLRTNARESYVETSALKTIVAFLNSEGGTLLIGVSDSLQIVGIDRELDKFHKGAKDKFLLHFKNRLRSDNGENFYPFISYQLNDVDGRRVLQVKCDSSSKPCFLKGNEFYVRTNPATDKLEGSKLLEYVRSHFTV